MNRIVVGIDPGITGAVAWLGLSSDQTATLLDVQDMPVANVKSGRTTKSEIILPVLADLLKLGPGVGLGLPVTVLIENVHAMPGQGVTSMFRFGYATGAVAGVVSALGFALTTINPQEWQRVAQVRKDPDAGRLRAGQLFPKQAHFFARKKDHNRADASLIAYAGAYQALGVLPITHH